jgi:predicted MFS family arabinose efflux permease
VKKATYTSIINCVAGIIGSIYIGKLLDKHRNYKNMQIYIAIGVSFTVLVTFLSL